MAALRERYDREQPHRHFKPVFNTIVWGEGDVASSLQPGATDAQSAAKPRGTHERPADHMTPDSAPGPDTDASGALMPRSVSARAEARPQAVTRTSRRGEVHA